MRAVLRARSVHWLDHAAGVLTRRRRLFTGGWGDEGVLEKVPAIARFSENCRPVLFEARPGGRLGAPDCFTRSHEQRRDPVGPKGGRAA